MAGEEVLVRVHHEWRGWRSAEVRMSDLHDLHWHQPAGAPHPLLHAYVSCSDIVSGDIPEACAGRRDDHRLLVCILKRHTPSSAYLALSRRTGPRRSLTLKEDPSPPAMNRFGPVRVGASAPSARPRR